MKTNRGKIILMPLPIGPESAGTFITAHYLEIVKNTKYWVAENARTTRRFLSSLHTGINISELEIFELERGFREADLYLFLDKNIPVGNIAVTSEAGLPGMADPGSVVVRWAHKNQIVVQPQTGPGSVYLALCASGFNGQQFVFHGYCPIKDDELKKFLAELVKHQRETGYSQIFIETPYRNDRLIRFMTTHLPGKVQMCIARGLQSENEFIRTMSVEEWAAADFSAGKEPCVFIIGS